MQKVKIKRVQKNKKKLTTKEKVLAGLGLGATILGGAAGLSTQSQKQTRIVSTTKSSDSKSKSTGLLSKVFGAPQAKAFDEEGNPQEGDTKEEDGFAYVFYQGGWVLANGQTKTENGISYGSEGGQWILLDSQTKTEGGFQYGSLSGNWILLDGQSKQENGHNYHSSGGQWVDDGPITQGPKIGEEKTEGGYVYQCVTYNNGEPVWALKDNQTKVENGHRYHTAQGAWVDDGPVEQGPQEGDTRTEDGFRYVYYQGNWVLANGQEKTEGGFKYGSQGGQWILLDNQIKTEGGKTYISIGGQWVQRDAGLSVEGSTKTEGGYKYTVVNGQWKLDDGQTKVENGYKYHSSNGSWVNDGPAITGVLTSVSANFTTYDPGLDSQMASIHDQLATDLANGSVTTFNGDSVTAYLLGLGGSHKEGDTTVVSGRTYKFDGSSWNLVSTQTIPTTTSRVDTANGRSVHQVSTDGGRTWTDAPQEGDTDYRNNKQIVYHNGQWTEWLGGMSLPTMPLYEAAITNNGNGRYTITLNVNGQTIPISGTLDEINDEIQQRYGTRYANDAQIFQSFAAAITRINSATGGVTGQVTVPQYFTGGGASSGSSEQANYANWFATVWFPANSSRFPAGTTAARAMELIGPNAPAGSATYLAEASAAASAWNAYQTQLVTDFNYMVSYNNWLRNGRVGSEPAKPAGFDSRHYADGTLRVNDPNYTAPATGQNSTPTVTYNGSSTPKVGDGWSITVTGRPGDPVYVTVNGSTSLMGYIDGTGRLNLSGTFTADMLSTNGGRWVENWTVGGRPGTSGAVQAGTVSFNLSAQTVSAVTLPPATADGYSAVVTPGSNGSFTVQIKDASGAVITTVTATSAADLTEQMRRFNTANGNDQKIFTALSAVLDRIQTDNSLARLPAYTGGGASNLESFDARQYANYEQWFKQVWFPQNSDLFPGMTADAAYAAITNLNDFSGRYVQRGVKVQEAWNNYLTSLNADWAYMMNYNLWLQQGGIGNPPAKPAGFDTRHSANGSLVTNAQTSNTLSGPSSTGATVPGQTATNGVATVTMRNANGGNTYAVGDRPVLTITNAARNAPVYAVGGIVGTGGGTTYLGRTDANGNLTVTTNPFAANQTGNWSVTIVVGASGAAEIAAPLSVVSTGTSGMTVIGTLTFTVTAASSNPGNNANPGGVNTSIPAPVISGVQVNTQARTITITGTRFNTTAGRNTIRITNSAGQTVGYVATGLSGNQLTGVLTATQPGTYTVEVVNLDNPFIPSNQLTFTITNSGTVNTVGTLSFTNTNGSSVFRVGDTWRLAIAGAAPNTDVFAIGGEKVNGVVPSDRVKIGTTDAQGNLVLTKQLQTSDIGDWQITIMVGNNTLGNPLVFTVLPADEGGSTAPSVTLSRTSVSMQVGQTATVNASVTIQDTVTRRLSVSSSNPAVATVTFDSATGIISITGVSAGTTTITVHPLDATGIAQDKTITVTVAPVQVGSLVLPGGVLPTGTANIRYATRILAQGGSGAVAYAVTAGSLPPGLYLNSDGTIDATAQGAGTYTFTVTAIDAQGHVSSAQYTITINPPFYNAGGGGSGYYYGFNPVTYQNPQIAGAVAYQGLQMPSGMAGLRDISYRYANVDGTIYDKTTGHAFSTPQEFFAAAGVDSFDHVLFDTEWRPGGQVKGAATVRTYTVKKGDTLWGIAKKHYGDGNQWRKIMAANSSKIKSTRTLKIGTQLVIPD